MGNVLLILYQKDRVFDPTAQHFLCKLCLSFVTQSTDSSSVQTQSKNSHLNHRQSPHSTAAAETEGRGFRIVLQGHQ